MGAVIGLLAGVGMLLIWHGLTPRPPRIRSATISTRLRETLREAGLPTTSPAQIIGFQALAALIIFVVSFATTGSLSISGIFAVFGAYIPWMLVKRMRLKRQTVLRELWPEIVDHLTSGVRAGLSLSEGLANLGIHGPEPLRATFTTFASDYRVTGDFNTSLTALRRSLADPVADRICESLRIAREVGGTDLGRLLSTLGEFLREESRTRSELLARQSWSISAARMAVIAPWLVLLMLGTRPETRTAYDTPTGVIILIIGAVASIAAYRVMLRIGRLPVEKRVLR